MLPDISEIKIKRKQMDLTQSELAQKAGVSQSLLAKIEAGKLVPSYLNAKKIFDFFESMHEKSMLRARDMMMGPVKKIEGNASIEAAIKMMKKNAISQLPVVLGETIVGAVSENIIVDKMQQAKDLEGFKKTNVSQIMGDSLPTVSESTPFNAVSALLDYNASVLVLEEGKIRGIISRSDLLGSLLKKKTKAV